MYYIVCTMLQSEIANLLLLLTNYVRHDDSAAWVTWFRLDNTNKYCYNQNKSAIDQDNGFTSVRASALDVLVLNWCAENWRQCRGPRVHQSDIPSKGLLCSRWCKLGTGSMYVQESNIKEKKEERKKNIKATREGKIQHTEPWEGLAAGMLCPWSGRDLSDAGKSPSHTLDIL